MNVKKYIFSHTMLHRQIIQCILKNCVLELAQHNHKQVICTMNSQNKKIPQSFCCLFAEIIIITETPF